MRASEIIAKKRGTFVTGGDGLRSLARSVELSEGEINSLIEGYVAGEIPDYQMSAWLMAVYFNGMTREETGFLTRAMIHSGATIDLRSLAGLSGPFVDKHSTGGVGDKISLPLAPIAACLGVQVPMMSGRALGHTGGTLDKLESMEGYRVDLSAEEFARGIKRNGFAMMGQTKDIVPADRLLYALRDVTGTVESIPLITASILSKKTAEGAEALAFDVKCGSGAFMKSQADAEALALSLVGAAKTLGLKASALVTRMDTPLGLKVGNFLEIEETLDCLEGRGPSDVMEEVRALACLMATLGGKARDSGDALPMVERALSSGAAMEKFLANVSEQGGDPRALLAERGKRRSPHHAALKAKRSGFVSIDACKLGMAGVHLGVGRAKTTDSVCPDAGFILRSPQGAEVREGDIVMDIYGKDSLSLAAAMPLIESAVAFSDAPPASLPRVIKEISG